MSSLVWATKRSQLETRAFAISARNTSFRPIVTRAKAQRREASSGSREEHAFGSREDERALAGRRAGAVLFRLSRVPPKERAAIRVGAGFLEFLLAAANSPQNKGEARLRSGFPQPSTRSKRILRGNT